MSILRLSIIRLIWSSNVSWSSSSSTSPFAQGPRAYRPLAALPPWLECASSMMMANLRSRWSLLDVVHDEGELLDGGDDDFLPLGR